VTCCSSIAKEEVTRLRRNRRCIVLWYVLTELRRWSKADILWTVKLFAQVAFEIEDVRSGKAGLSLNLSLSAQHGPDFLTHAAVKSGLESEMRPNSREESLYY
jgi:hypothetical protein